MVKTSNFVYSTLGAMSTASSICATWTADVVTTATKFSIGPPTSLPGGGSFRFSMDDIRSQPGFADYRDCALGKISEAVHGSKNGDFAANSGFDPKQGCVKYDRCEDGDFDPRFLEEVRKACAEEHLDKGAIYPEYDSPEGNIGKCFFMNKKPEVPKPSLGDQTAETQGGFRDIGKESSTDLVNCPE
ncbi:hypothetical protein QFC21_005319 [Naganishia friedmannii]|uniref:Uncharacterized protein n=1 Tax=Naganishia friedmannii TaxID=89922 RepID=A0ACC2VBK9_9TREE|nr:hypothetical protein QFC21_005319 [Naganishia friedmannii]